MFQVYTVYCIHGVLLSRKRKGWISYLAVDDRLTKTLHQQLSTHLHMTVTKMTRISQLTWLKAETKVKTVFDKLTNPEAYVLDDLNHLRESEASQINRKIRI
ncbi:uncharacterized protein [Rutidosis leptorrhynchoides]|uniref:uncharacterized protein n=1 Tax=Rutidosis leptorrhynchoides TaxID=125765 RepID=UPI003A991B31